MGEKGEEREGRQNEKGRREGDTGWKGEWSRGWGSEKGDGTGGRGMEQEGRGGRFHSAPSLVSFYPLLSRSCLFTVRC